jgi:hypothetical protein
MQTIRTPVLVSKPYAARRSSMACKSPKSPDAVLFLDRKSKTSIVEERRRENCRGLRTGVKALAVGS